MFNAQWRECGLTSVSNVTSKFSSTTTYICPGSNNDKFIYIDSTSKEIQLRKEHGTSIVSGINSSKIYGSRGTVSNYAVDTINLDYR